MPYTDTFPANPELKERVKRLQIKVAQIKNVPKLSQLDLLDIITKEYEESIIK